MRPAHAENWALLIGIDQYDDSNNINPLGAAAADARALARTLHDVAGFADDHMRLLVSDGETKPTGVKIIDGLSWLRRNARPGDTVFVLYSGHGVELNGTPYLIPFDAIATDDDTLAETAIPAAKFKSRLAQIKARALILAFDMCRSDPHKAGKAVAAADNTLTKNLARGLEFAPTATPEAPSAAPPVAITLYPCSEGERSYEWSEKGRGFFSYFLEQGMRGKAADASGQVTALSLAQYVERETRGAVQREEHKAQTPYPSLDGPGADRLVLATVPVENTALTAPEVGNVDTIARLVVTTTASNATIVINEMELADGQYTLNLGLDKSREVEVGVMAKGYEPWVKRVKLLRGQTLTLPVPVSALVPAPPATTARPSQATQAPQGDKPRPHPGPNFPGPPVRPGELLEALQAARAKVRNRPVITEAMRQAARSRVKVEFTIAPNGSSSYRIVASSGDSEVDAAVLKACAGYRWQAATRGGKPIESKQVVVFDPRE